MMLKKILRITLGLVFALSFCWLLARQISIDDLRHSFFDTSPLWVAAGLLAFFAGYASRIERWRLMLLINSPSLRWRDCAGPFLGSFAANNILPFRAGDVLRAFAFNQRLGTTSGVVLATLFVERLLDLLMVLLFLLSASIIFDLEIGGVTGVGRLALVSGAFLICFLIFFPRTFTPIAISVCRGISHIFPKIGEKLLNEISKFSQALFDMANGGRMIRLIIWSGFAWIAEGCVFWFAALALPSIVNPAGGWLAVSLGTLATLIPSTPGYVGTFDFVVVRAMNLMGNSNSSSTAYAILTHFLLWFPPTIIGGLYFLFRPIHKKLNE